MYSIFLGKVFLAVWDNINTRSDSIELNIQDSYIRYIDLLYGGTMSTVWDGLFLSYFNLIIMHVMFSQSMPVLNEFGTIQTSNNYNTTLEYHILICR